MFDAERMIEKRRQTVEGWLKGHGISDMSSFEDMLKREDLYASSSLREKVQLVLNPATTTLTIGKVVEEVKQEEQMLEESTEEEAAVSSSPKKNKKVIIPKQ